MTAREKSQKYGPIMKEETTALRPNALQDSIHQVLPLSATTNKGCQTLINFVNTSMTVKTFPDHISRE